MTPLLWTDTDMPNADDPSDTLEQSVERLCDSIDRRSPTPTIRDSQIWLTPRRGNECH